MSENQDISLSLRKNISEQINSLVLLSRNSHQNPELLVHELRKGIKRMRSLFRLFKPVIKDEDFHRINEMIAETGRLLTLQRESIVNFQTFKEIENKLSNYLSEDSKVIILQQLNNQIADTYSNAVNLYNNKILNVSFQLSKIRDIVNNLNVNKYSSDLLKLAIENTYLKTLKFYSDCKISLHTEAIHKLRRFSKHLFFQLKFKPILDSEKNHVLLEQLELLSEILGKEHDYVTLNQLFIKYVYKIIEPKDRTILFQTIEKERNNLQKKAFALCREIFVKEFSLTQHEFVHI
jgi:CHAD domain-containing protein